MPQRIYTLIHGQEFESGEVALIAIGPIQGRGSHAGTTILLIFLKKATRDLGTYLLRFPEAGRTRLVDFFCERKSKKCRGAAEPAGRGKICPVARSHCRLLTSSCCALSALSENIKSLQQKQQHKKTGDSKRKVEGCC